MLDDHGAGDAPPGVSHQVFQQAEFFRRQFDPPSGALHPPLHPVKFQIVYLQHRLRRHMASPHQGPDARGKLGKRKWFSQIVIGSQVETLHPVFHASTAGQHQYRHARFAGSQETQNRNSIQARKVQIEYHQVKIQFARHGTRLLPIGRNINRIVLRFQALFHETCQGSIVFRDQYAHKVALMDRFDSSL